MPPWVVLPFLGPALLTLLAAVVLLAGPVAGLAVYCIRPLRFAAPFVLFVPTLTALGAGIGSWGLAYLANERYPTSDLAAWAWVFGYPAGALCGFLAGLALALLVRGRPRAAGRSG